jgi:hypothetical protein
VPVAERSLVTALSDREETAGFVLIEPATWSPAAFDTLAQELVRTVFDLDGRPLALVLPQTPDTVDALAALESTSPKPGAQVFGSLRIRAGALALEPITVLDETTVTSLGLSHVPVPATATASSPAAVDDDADPALDDADEIATPPGKSGVQRVLSALWLELEATASVGVRAYRGWDRLAELSAKAKSLGLLRCSESLDSVARATAPSRRAARILDAAWVVRLTSGACSVRTAASRYA